VHVLSVDSSKICRSFSSAKGVFYTWPEALSAAIALVRELKISDRGLSTASDTDDISHDQLALMTNTELELFFEQEFGIVDCSIEREAYIVVPLNDEGWDYVHDVVNISSMTLARSRA
jgi:hypothetical protein